MPRIIPCLLLQGKGLVKTRKFKQPVYLGDPVNVVRIFNSKEADELLLLDILATEAAREPDYAFIESIASECFMPLSYGGGVGSVEVARRLFNLGVEKVVINAAAHKDPTLIPELAQQVGSQSVVVAMDVRRRFWGKPEVYYQRAQRAANMTPQKYAEQIQKWGAGEIFLNDVDQDGAMNGFDLELIRNVSACVDIPVVACGGAGSIQDLWKAVSMGGASAVSAGSLFVFQGKHRAVLISYPTREALKKVFADAEGNANETT